MRRVDIEAIIRSAEPGTMIFNPIDVGRGWEFAFLIREEDRILDRLVGKGRIEFRVGVWPVDGVVLLPLMLRITADGNAIYYESWLNVADPESRECLRLLASQDRVLVLFYGDDGRRKRTEIINAGRSIYQQIYEALRPASWSMAAFDRARAKLCAKYTTPEALWNALDQIH